MAFLGIIFKTLDVRDIKEKVIYPEGRGFEEIFKLQKELLEGYVKIEGLPQWPIDLNTRKSQDLIKDFSARIIEELGEGFESYLTMMDMFHNGIDEKRMIPHLQNFNEEVADALHFWLELMIYSGYESKKVYEWASFHLDSSMLKGVDHLVVWFGLGEIMVNKLIPAKAIPCRWVIKDHQLTDEFLRGGRQLGKSRRDYMKQFLWDITYYLQLARNTLKNKPWKQSEMTTDLNQYGDAMRGLCEALFKFLYFAGFTPESLYHIYYKKNQVNKFRQKSKY